MEIGGAGKRMRAVDGKQEINLEWPNMLGKGPIMPHFMPNYALCHDEPNMPKIMLA